jgi:hypothetical protein
VEVHGQIVLAPLSAHITRIGRGSARAIRIASAFDRQSRMEGDAVSVSQTELDRMEEELREMGPVDYVVLAWPGGVPSGDGTVMRLIIDLVERGIIRVLDVAFAAKDEDGNVVALDLEHLGDDSAFTEFAGASSGLLSFEDVQEAAATMEPGTAAAILVWENRWAAPVAIAMRKSGGLLVDSGRIPVQGIIAALDALEAAEVN